MSMRKTIIVLFCLVPGLLVSCGLQEETFRIPEVYKDGGQEGGGPTEKPFTIEARAVVKSSFDEPLVWTPFTAVTMNCLEGFTPSVDPVKDRFGGWKVNIGAEATGAFHIEEAGGRKWLVTPDGNPYILVCMNRFSFGSSDRMIKARDAMFGGRDGWLSQEVVFLKETGFNSVGAWSQTALISEQTDEAKKIPYIVIYQPTSAYNGDMKSRGLEKDAYADKSVDDNWYGYPYSFPMIFNDDYEAYADNVIKDAARYRDDPYCIGYFIDNELPWVNHGLDYCLGKWPAGHVNHTVAQQWLDERKGKTGATLSEVTDDDRKAFVGYCFDKYLEKVSGILRRYDPNHLFFGPRMSHWRNELDNDYVFRAAGKWLDAWCFNHYRYWEPDVERLKHYSEVSGLPGMITEFYVKGDDTDAYYHSGHSGLTNTSGAGWLVHTQEERGIFYQNFALKLLQCPDIIGWNYFMYIDNDPEDPDAAAGEVDGNKGVLTCEFERYTPLVDRMKAFNNNVFNLAKYYMTGNEK